jgi:hypothetical protein
MRKTQPPIRITILTNPTKTRTRSVAPIREEETHLSAAWDRPPLSPLFPEKYTILSLSPADSETHSIASIQNTDSSSPSIRHSHSPPRIVILVDPAREIQCAEQHGSPESTQSRQNLSAATLTAMPVPTTRPVSILQRPSDDVVKEAKVKVLIPAVVVHGPASYEEEAKTNVRYLGTDMASMASQGKIPRISVVNSRGRLNENNVAFYYPKEPAAEKIRRRLRSVVRSGRRLAAARRRGNARQRREALAAYSHFSDLFVSRPGAHTSTSTPL